MASEVDTKTAEQPDIGEYKYGFRDSEDNYVFKSRKGLDKEIVQQISEMKNEPEWMREYRLQALETFFNKLQPEWGGANDYMTPAGNKQHINNSKDQVNEKKQL